MFELILSPLISVKFKLSNSVFEMNLMALRQIQSRRLTSIKGHINPFWTGCYPGWWQSAKSTEYLLPNSSIRLVSRLYSHCSHFVSSFLSSSLHFLPLPNLTSTWLSAQTWYLTHPWFPNICFQKCNVTQGSSTQCSKDRNFQRKNKAKFFMIGRHHKAMKTI